MSRITKNLEKIFERERIVFWYDENGEMRQEFEALALEDVAVLEVENNEFSLKYRMVKEEPQRKFLLYFPYARPENSRNWLLDLFLANFEFKTDEAEAILQDLGLPLELKKVVEEHKAFFRSSARYESLKELASSDDTEQSLRYKMLGVVCGTASKLEEITLSLVTECSEGREEKFKRIKTCNLEGFFWKEMGTYFGYRTKTPSIRDFVYSLFVTAWRTVSGGPSPLSSEGLIFLNRWKDSASSLESFKKMSAEVAHNLHVESALNQEALENLLKLDIYEQVDKKILLLLVGDILSGSISHSRVKEITGARKKTLWYEKYKDYYGCLEKTSEFLDRVKNLDLSLKNARDAFEKYTSVLYRLDQLYRQFLFFYRRTGPDSTLIELYNRVHNHYSNSFLLELNDRWQQHVNSMDTWEIETVPGQRSFYRWYVDPYPKQGKKVFVVISDALRYEAAAELKERILKLDRYQAEIESVLGVLPSYTQLGMAALLPHKKLAFGENFSNVLVDGSSSQGLAARNDILKKVPTCKAMAMGAEEFLNLNAHEEGRRIFRENDVIYIYHNGIDKTGDSKDSEGRVVEAVEEEFDTLLKIIKKIVNVNGTNILITSDHGFIYQDKAIEQSDFALYEPPEGASVINRRFVIGRDLKSQPAFRKFTSPQLGLEGSADVLIPKSINRLRVKGSGSRFVHGGASLQETVVPVLVVRKLRSSDVTLVAVDVISQSRITSRQPVFNFYQTEPVGEKVHPRELRIGLYTLDGRPLSEIKKEIFDSADEMARAREKKLSFLLSREADSQNTKEVLLKLEEPAAPGVSQHRIYKEITLTLSLSFEGDFEDF